VKPPQKARFLASVVPHNGDWLLANHLQMNPAKTELLWAGSKHNTSLLSSHAPVLHLRSDTVTPSCHDDGFYDRDTASLSSYESSPKRNCTI